MNDIFKDKPYVKDIRNIELIGAIELKDNLLPNIRVGKEIYNLALKKECLLDLLEIVFILCLHML